MKDVVMVLGMHRSGTSALAGTLARLGCATPATLMPANAGNSRGYFESKALMALHDEILASAGSNWRDWRPFDPDWYQSATAAAFRLRAKDVFAAEFGDANLAVLKDPRICRFAPFWLSLLRDIDARIRIVIPFRSPVEVCQSLQRQHGLPIGVGSLLWLRHVLDAEVQSRLEIRSIFSWDHLQSDWRRVIAKIALDTGVSWPRYSDCEAQDIDDYLIRNQAKHEGAIAQPTLHEWTTMVHGALLELARNAFSRSARNTLDRVRALLDQSSRLFGSVLNECENELNDMRDKRKNSEIAAQNCALALESARSARQVTGTAKAEREARYVAVAANLDQCLLEKQRLAVDLDLISAQLGTMLTDTDASKRAVGPGDVGRS